MEGFDEREMTDMSAVIVPDEILRCMASDSLLSGTFFHFFSLMD